jgi:hypothetical protein
MKFYRDHKNEIYAYEEDGSQDHLIGDKIAVTEQEANSILSVRQAQQFESLSYVEKRRAAYPTIGEQLDALYHAGVFPPDMAERIRAVKQRYPKN